METILKMYELGDLEKNIFIIKLFFVILYTYLCNFKFANKKIVVNLRLFCEIFTIGLLALICSNIKYEVNYFISIICIIGVVSVIFSRIYKDSIGSSILITTLSITFNYMMLTASIILNFIITLLIKNVNNDFINLFGILIIYTILLYMFFKNKKLKYGFNFLRKNDKSEVIDIFILNISVIVLFANIIITNYEKVLGRNLFFIFIIFPTIMFIILQKALQLYYKQKLFEKELNETKAKLEEKEKEVKELEAENLKISKNSHTLSHKQKSLEYKIEQMMTKVEISTEEAAEVRDRVKEIEKDLYKEKSAIKLDKTGIPLIDDMLEYMQSECKKNKIDFELQIKGNIHYMTNNLITKEDLETLLADHIKNAIIAINHTENVNRSILVRLGEIDGTYSLYIYDSGIEFTKETLENLGKKPSTTHANEGGTGMGFMNTFDTLRKCEASLIINELNEPSKENYTKAIIIKFDKKNEFQVISYR